MKAASMPFAIGLIVVGAILVFFFLRNRVVVSGSARIDDIPAIVEKMQQSDSDPRFAHFMFGPGDSRGSNNIQFSVENGVVGLDWVLITPQNIRDKDAVIAFAKQHGFLLVEKEENGVKYLRVEGATVVELGQKILSDFYKLPADEQLDLVTEGFKWQQPRP